MNIILDGLLIESEDDFHDAIAKELSLPIWYGRNLDALWDVLTGIVERPVNLVWVNSEISRKRLQRYKTIINLFKDVAQRDNALGHESKFKFTLK
ncbi:barnase inhibitor [Pectobacterium versatile]|uniref:barstar family protein n=1 Tax=Pectobacterium versatile TaxID=2488639 RepID=UPI000B7BAA96|nr:barstar family protein [Pectobacterium versatile]ASN85569.1 Barstar (Barnase inhibitor) [Pectobacterium versatile]MBQ4762993.1 barnase inhibitor [Pectobacterium versatile]MCA6928755.1 barstar family protein [Pectobacterium versatile]MCH5085498.1 barstar family protein [Pectobacterium versatile]PVY74990.1 ribonuclease inhibitor [Pectobacterium versatile]